MLGSDDELDWMPSELSKVSSEINPLPRVTESKLSQVLESTTTEAEQRTKILTPGFAHGAVDSVFNAYRTGAKCLLKGNRRTVTHGYSIIRNRVYIGELIINSGIENCKKFLRNSYI